MDDTPPRFGRDNEIDERVLPSLTAEDLKELGVNLIGHRRLLLDAIAALREAGAKQAASPLPAVPPQPAASSVDAERRQLTVMFCDIVGSTALSTQFDPEDLRELVSGYRRAVAYTVGRFDGFVAQYVGDGVLIYFGYPRTHEDDAVVISHLLFASGSGSHQRTFGGLGRSLHLKDECGGVEFLTHCDAGLALIFPPGQC